MILTQDDLIKQIANKEDINVATVRNIFKSAENIIFDYLSSTTPSENKSIRLLDGLSLECNYIPEKEIHTYDDIVLFFASTFWTKLQNIFGHCCKTFLDIVACPNWTKLQ